MLHRNGSKLPMSQLGHEHAPGSLAATTEVPHKADRIAEPPFSRPSLYRITVSSDIRQVLRQGYSRISVAQRQSKVRLSAGGPKNGGSYGHIRRACHVQRAGHRNL